MLPLHLLIDTLLNYPLLYLQTGLDLLHPLLVRFLQGLVLHGHSLFRSFQSFFDAALTLLSEELLGFLRLELSFQLFNAGLPEFLSQI